MMNKHKTYTIKGTEGRFFWEDVDLPNPKRGICFVPEHLMKEGEFDEKTYTNLRWASFNCVAVEAYGIGSHMFPNPGEPVLEETEEEKARVEEYLKRRQWGSSENLFSGNRCETPSTPDFQQCPMVRTIYKRDNVEGTLAVIGREIIAANGSFFRKTYDLKAIAGEDKKSTKQEARMTAMIREAMPDEKYFPDVLGYGPDFIETKLIPGKTMMSLLDLAPFSKPPDFKQDDEDDIRSAWKTLKLSDQKIKSLHIKGYVHRDLHLDNIMLVKDEAGIHAALIDFEKSTCMPEVVTKAKAQIEYDRRFILQAALLIGFKIIEFQEDPLFQEAFVIRKQLFWDFAGMTLEECSEAVALTSQ
jgi:tRNA A-37 threonylcarbamoyl transferase component Bud32